MQYIKSYKKDIVIDLRKKGFSYSEIERQTHLPKSTIAFWLKGVKMSPDQIKKLENRRREVAIRNAQKKILETRETIEKIKDSSSREIGKISKREFWLMGIIMYWRERQQNEIKNNFKNGISFSSLDPALIKFFIKWLRDIGGIKNDEILLDIFTKSMPEKAVQYWAEITGFSESKFSRIYIDKKRSITKKPKRKRSNNQNGFLRIRVKGSSILARQIAGWIKGIQIGI